MLTLNLRSESSGVSKLYLATAYDTALGFHAQAGPDDTGAE